MLHAIQFRDDPEADPGISPRHMEAHLAFLQENAGAIRAASPLNGTDRAVAGGLLPVDVPDADAAWALVRADPFCATGLRNTADVRERAQVFADGARCV